MAESRLSSVISTISNSDFDGNTKYSSSCDGHHYWGFITEGPKTQVTLANNYIHTMSGRSPKVGGYDGKEVIMHAVNNYFDDILGHAFDVSIIGYILAEGNYFNAVKQPNLNDTDGSLWVPTAARDCSATIGRDCVLNTVSADSGYLVGYNEANVQSKIAPYKSEIGGFATAPAAKLTLATKNYGVGELH